MNFTKGLLVALLGILAMPASGSGNFENSTFSEYYGVTAPQIELRSTEGINGFTLDTVGAVILSMKVPFQWNVSVDNADGGRSQLKADAIVESSAFEAEGARYFNNFVEIGKIDAKISPPFDIKLVLRIIDHESEKERTVMVPLDRLRLTRRSEP
ncbi:MAG: hypothetical protein WCA22_07540 [Candidatus Binatus sp.]